MPLEGAHLGIDVGGSSVRIMFEGAEGAAKGYASADSRVRHGKQGTAGSWGWLPLPGAGSKGVHDDIERLAAGAGLSRRAASLAPMSATELAEAVRAGKRPAQQEVASFANAIGPGPAGMAYMFDPDVISLGGGLTPAVNVPSARTQKPLRRWASPSTRDVLVPRATPGIAAGTVGGSLASPAQIPVRL